MPKLNCRGNEEQDEPLGDGGLVFTTLGNKGCIVHPIFQTMGLEIKDFKLLAKVTNF